MNTFSTSESGTGETLPRKRGVIKAGLLGVGYGLVVGILVVLAIYCGADRYICPFSPDSEECGYLRVFIIFFIAPSCPVMGGLLGIVILRRPSKFRAMVVIVLTLPLAALLFWIVNGGF